MLARRYQPLSWWAVASILCNGVVARAFCHLADELCDWAEAGVFREDMMTGLDDDAAYRLKQAIRFRKTSKFLADPSTPLRLTVACAALTQCLDELAGFFQDATYQAPGNVVAYCWPASSPAVRAVNKIARELSNQGSPNWTLVHGGAGWTGLQLGLAANTFYGLLGDIYLRCIFPFFRYPWRLAWLIHPDTAWVTRLQLIGCLS